ncbi:MAG: hypothetical protein HYY16_19795 [Planctomycetes bacterium]|nr:hypothetical protein [Planctomycetota bacterium]
MRSLFHAFSRRRVRYLLIGGQASVAYGAATFSQDLDVWIEPTPRNVRRFLTALSDLRARVHKLTPPLTPRIMKRGHGFHFVVPLAGESPLYLDAMGRPPRVSGFRSARRRSKSIETPWGSLPIVSIEDLVDLKKTNRPADYDVITRLALIRLEGQDHPSRRRLRWALEHVFRAEDLWTFVSRYGADLDMPALRIHPAAALLHRIACAGKVPDARAFASVARRLSRRVEALQDRGRAYWLPRIAELRALRSRGALLAEGTPVRELLARST